MAPVVFHLTALKSAQDKDAFISALKSLPSVERPLWVAACHQWINEPHLSAKALTGPGKQMQVWDHVLVFKSPSPENPQLPAALETFVATKWSITAEVEDAMIDSLPTRKSEMIAARAPALPVGWSAENHKGIDAAKDPSDVKISLETPSRLLGSDKSSGGVPMKTIIRDIGLTSPGPVAMLNLLSYLPGQRHKYIEFQHAFLATVGPKYSGQPLLVGLGVSDWSSRDAEEAEGQDGKWEDVALLRYPEIWHFAKMLDDPVYTELDRRYKTDVVRDNTIICCSEVDLD